MICLYNKSSKDMQGILANKYECPLQVVDHNPAGI